MLDNAYIFIHNYLIIIIGVEFFKRSFANRVEAGDEALRSLNILAECWRKLAGKKRFPG